MTFREMAFRDEATTLALQADEAQKHFLQSMLDSQSPIMKFWFVIMMLNLAMFLFILQ